MCIVVGGVDVGQSTLFQGRPDEVRLLCFAGLEILDRGEKLDDWHVEIL